MLRSASNAGVRAGPAEQHRSHRPLGCRTGYPDLKLYERMDGVDIIGIDSSLPALELARNKAAVLGDVAVDYRFAEELPLELEGENFTHAYSIHPISGPQDRALLFGEISRLLCG